MNLPDIATFFALFIVFVAIGWVVGDVLLRGVIGEEERRPSPHAIGLTERALASILGFVAFSVVLMIVHMATLGRVFGLPGLVPVAGILVLVVGWRRGVWPRRVPWGRVGGGLAILVTLYAAPFLLGGSSIRSGDSPWHMGRTFQLLGGEMVPGGPAAGFDLNGYPWGLHAVMATMVRLVPGSDPADALTTLSFVISCGLPLAAACLARRVEPRAGWAAAGCMALIGGFGWIQAGGPTFFTSPDVARYGADLMTASPNGLYALLPPALPRELGLVLVGLLGVLVTHAARRAEPIPPILVGVSLGVLGLLSVPMALNGAAWIFAGILFLGRRRIRLLVLVYVPAAAVFALWAVPVTVGYLTYGGFVDVTPNIGREWPLSTALGSWGLLLPLAAAGVVMCLAQDRSRARPLLAFGVAAVATMSLAIARGIFDWQVLGVPHLLHQGRMWPPAHLLASAFGGLALYAGYRMLQRRGRRLAGAAAALLLVVGSISAIYASLALTGIIRRSGDGFVYSAEDFQEGSFLLNAGGRLVPKDVVRVSGPPNLDLYLFQYSGARIANFDDPQQSAYDPRIRYRELALRWHERVTDGGFDADLVVTPAGRAPRGRVLARGPYEGATFVLVARD